ncbi:MAG TPA: DUF302 domain-containing protein [Chloroflexota bacterium]
MTTSMTASSLGFGLELPLSYERAIAQVTAALKEQGFGVLTTIDVKATLKEKLGEEFRPYAILGACNPPLAHRALSTDLEVGLMLPCNVVVYELDSKTSRVEFLDPLVALGVMGNQLLAPVAREARQRLEQVAKSLTE